MTVLHVPARTNSLARNAKSNVTVPKALHAANHPLNKALLNVIG